MSNEKRSFPALIHVYLVFSCALVIFAPVLVAIYSSRNQPLGISDWSKAFVLAAVFGAILLLSSTRISTEKLSYRDGLLYITAYCTTGWVYTSLILVIPAIAATLIYSALISIYGVVRNKPSFPQEKFHALIKFVYRNRAR